MKKLTTLLMALGLIACTVMISKPAKAQFTPASVPETYTGAGTSCGNTGNDYKKSMYGIGGFMAANVWDGANAGLGWDDFAGNSGFLTFANPTSDPDVTLIEDGGNWWAIVAYFSNGSGYFADFYKWTGSSFALSSSNLLSSCSTMGNSINIDGDVTGDFVITWDDNCTNDIQVIGGSTLLSGGPTLCNGGVPISATGSGSCRYPDVTLYSIDGSTPQYGIYHLVYLNSNYQKIYVSFDKFTTLCAGFSNNISAFAALAPNVYYTPRISCPPAAQGSLKDWSVVVTDVSGSGYDVLGYTELSGTVYSYNYTDGSIILPAISQWNKYPAISYDNSYTGIIISWKSFFTGAPGTFVPDAPVAIQCKVSGAYIGYSICTNGYMVVPSNNLSSMASQDAISVAGRDATDMFYTFCDNNAPDIAYKTVPFLNCNLRTSRPQSEKATLYPNPVSKGFNLNVGAKQDEIITLTITDLSGKSVVNYVGTIDQINEKSAQFTEQLLPGVYILHETSENTSSQIQLLKM